MPHDKNGKLLKVGDFVDIPCKIESIYEGDEYCNLTVQTVEPMYPSKTPTAIAINTKQVILSVLLLMLLLAMSVPGMAQTQTDKFVFAGIGYSDANAPQIFGFGGVAIPVSGRILSYSDFDSSPLPKLWTNGKFTLPRLQFSARTGIAVNVYTITKGVILFGLANGGVAADGNTTGGSFAGGGFLDIAFNAQWGAIVVMQAERNNVTGTQFAPRFGVRYLLNK